MAVAWVKERLKLYFALSSCCFLNIIEFGEPNSGQGSSLLQLIVVEISIDV